MTTTSELAKKSLESIFPNREMPYTNINLKVELDIFMNESFNNTVHVSSTKDIIKSINEAACLITDVWLNDILPEDDDLSINDFGNVTVTILDLETPLVFDVEIDLSSYVKTITLKDVENEVDVIEDEKKTPRILELMDFTPFVNFSSIQKQPKPEPSIRTIILKYYAETYPELEAKKMADEYIESITQ